MTKWFVRPMRPVSLACIMGPCSVLVAACGPAGSGANEGSEDVAATSQAATGVPAFTVQSAPDDFLLAVSATSASDVWAVGMTSVLNANDQTQRSSVLHFNGTAWTRVPAVVPGDTDPFAEVSFNGVKAIAPNNAWLVGSHVDTSTGAIVPLIQHWNGTSWRAVASPTFPQGSASLSAITATSATDVWAVGDFPGLFIDPLVEHFDGHAWTQVQVPNGNGDEFRLLGVSADSPKDVWAVGSESEGDGAPPTVTRVMHFNGTSWTVQSTPNRFPTGGGSDQLNGVVALSPTNVWAVGAVTDTNSNSTTLIEHFDGTSWTIVPSPSPAIHSGFPANDQLTAVTAVSSNDVYAVGFEQTTLLDDNFSSTPLALHWDGSTWSIVPTPSPGTSPGGLVDDLLFGATSLPNGNVWFVGVGSDPNSFATPSLVLHASGG